MSGRAGKREKFDEVLKENSVYGRCKTTVNQWVLFGFSGFIMSVAPLIIYTSPMFDVSALAALPQIIAIIVGCTMLLAWAYRSVTLQRQVRLFSNMPPASKGATLKKERDIAQTALENKTSDLSTAYALMTVNAAYLLLWTACAFSFLPKISPNISSNLNHLFAISAPSIFLAARGATFLA